jgi:hypothetical protein
MGARGWNAGDELALCSSFLELSTLPIWTRGGAARQATAGRATKRGQYHQAAGAFAEGIANRTHITVL